MQEHERIAYARIAASLARHSSPLLCFSGGKDSLVTAYMLMEAAGRQVDAFTELSMLFPEDENDVRHAATALGYAPHYNYELTYEKLARCYQEVFPPERYVFWKMDVLRHRASIPKYVRKSGHDLLIFGRRRGENSVGKGHYYATEGRHTVLPIREWTEAQVWEFIKRNRIFYPRQYDGGLHQLRTWIGFLNEAYAENPAGFIGRLHARQPDIVERIAVFYAPARQFLDANRIHPA